MDDRKKENVGELINIINTANFFNPNPMWVNGTFLYLLTNLLGKEKDEFFKKLSDIDISETHYKQIQDILNSPDHQVVLDPFKNVLKELMNEIKAIITSKNSARDLIESLKKLSEPEEDTPWNRSLCLSCIIKCINFNSDPKNKHMELFNNELSMISEDSLKKIKEIILKTNMVGFNISEDKSNAFIKKIEEMVNLRKQLSHIPESILKIPKRKKYAAPAADTQKKPPTPGSKK